MSHLEVQEAKLVFGSARDQAWLVSPTEDDEVGRGWVAVITYGADRRLFCSVCRLDFDGEGCVHLKAAVDYHHGHSPHGQHVTPSSFDASMFVD